MGGRLHRLLDRIFGKAEEINGAERCPTYMYRWVVAARERGKLYLHKFIGDDWAIDLHDHPKRFVSIGVWGRYIEHLDDDAVKIWTAPWVRSFTAEHCHRLTLAPGETCWTLVWVGKPERRWGFWQDGSFIPWRDYVNGPAGDRGQACE